MVLAPEMMLIIEISLMGYFPGLYEDVKIEIDFMDSNPTYRFYKILNSIKKMM